MPTEPTSSVSQRAGTAAVLIAFMGFAFGQLVASAWSASPWWMVPGVFLGAVGLAGLGDTLARARRGER
jgi:hypothetical protein